MDYQVKLKVYEGPFDLLLDLISKEKLNIYEIPLAKITQDYLDYLERVKELELEQVTSFLIIAATLLEIKARSLLGEEEEEEVYLPQTKEELAESLLEYRKFKNVAFFLKERWEREKDFFPPQIYLEEILKKLPSHFLEDFSLRDLAQAGVASFLGGRPPQFFFSLPTPLKVGEKVKLVLEKIPGFKRQTFGTLIENSKEKTEVLEFFLALLELYKQGKVGLRQPQPFKEIEIWRRN